MIDEIKKSISATLYERTTSPLFGTFFFSWILWNWKIIIVLFLTESSELCTTKFEYIDTNLLDFKIGFLYPAISTIVILTVYAWLSEQAYRLWLVFDKRKNNYKNKIEKQKLLTVEQSMKLRLQIANSEEEFNNIIKDKDELISALKNDNKLLLEQSNKDKNTKNIVYTKKTSKDEFADFFSNEDATNHFEKISTIIVRNTPLHSAGIPDKIISFYVVHDLIFLDDESHGTYSLSDKGKKYLKEYYRRKNTAE